jgi:cardiolipin synthase
MDVLLRRIPPRFRLSRLLSRIRNILEVTHFPGNKVILLPHGGDFFPALFDAIRHARSSIFIEFYIIKNDATGSLFSQAIRDAAARGVQVSLIYDALGCFDTPDHFFLQLRQAGVQCLPFNPPTFAKLHWLDIRDHRKLVVIDGRTAFLGGLNVGDEYSGYGESITRWRDVGIRLDGPAVSELQRLFCQTWFEESGHTLAPHAVGGEAPLADADVVIVNGRPHQNRPVIRNAFRVAMSGAESSIQIITPYFVPGPRVVRSLLRAVRRKVRVQIILPSISDVPLVQMMSRAYLKPLLEEGVEIFERQGTILHAKVMLVDGQWVTLGSANLDFRSFHRNFEINVIVASEDFGRQVAALFDEELTKSKRFDLAAHNARGRLERLFAWLLAPLSRFL